ncbi:MAG: rhodanese-like protein [Paenibacillus sp.]|nr:rhodanese-like protein [Paenibacillus sp.]
MAQIIEGISHLDSQELQRLLHLPEQTVIVIDVREPEEYEVAHIPGVPLIPMGDIIDQLDDLDTAKEYVFVCRSGRRSLEVAKYFKANGFERVHNHLGGMLDWQSAGLDIAVGLEETT